MQKVQNGQQFQTVFLSALKVLIRTVSAIVLQHTVRNHEIFQADCCLYRIVVITEMFL